MCLGVMAVDGSRGALLDWPLQRRTRLVKAVGSGSVACVTQSALWELHDRSAIMRLP